MKLQDKILTILGLIVVIGYGYSMDMPQALQAPLRGQPCNLSSMQINLLYLSTYLPVIITDIPFGIILDKFPLQKTVIVIALSSFFSELFIAMLFDFRPEGYLYIVYVLKAINGMAGSSAFTMQGFIMVRYAAQNFEMMMGLGLSLPYIFSAINVAIVPYIYDSTSSISLPWYIASIFDSLAVVAAILISILVTKKQKRIKHESLLQSQVEGVGEQQQEEFKASYLFQLPRLFWIIIGAILINIVVMCIYQNLNDLIINRFSMDYVTIGYFMMIPYGLGSVFSLIFGHLLKVSPKIRRKLILLAPTCFSMGTVALYLLNNNQSASDVNYVDYIIITAFLIFLSMMTGSTFTVLSSSTSLLADKKRLGTAWGVIGVAIGLGQSISSMINGFVQSQDNLPQSYKNLTLIYMIISFVAVGMGFWILLGPFTQIDINFNDSKAKDKEEQERKLRATITTENQDDSI